MFAGFKQKDEAIKQFRKALEIQPDIKLDKILATPEVQEVFDEAVDAAEARPATEDAEAADGKPRPRASTHEPVTQVARRASAIPIKASVDPGLGAKKVVLSFSADGADDFAEREMKEDPPGSGGYIARDPGVRHARAASSTTTSRRWATTTRRWRRRARRARRCKIAMLGRTGSRWSRQAARGRSRDEAGRGRERRAWFLGLGLGSGVGWATGNGRGQRRRTRSSPPGFAPVASWCTSRPRSATSSRPSSCCRCSSASSSSRARPTFHDDPSDELRRRRRSARRPRTPSPASRGRATSSAKATSAPTSRAPSGLGTIRHVATFKSQPRLRHERRPDLRRHRAVGAGVRWARAPASSTTLTPGVRAHARRQRAARLHQLHVPRRPQRRRRVRVLARVRAAPPDASRSSRAPRAARARRRGGRRGGS